MLAQGRLTIRRPCTASTGHRRPISPPCPHFGPDLRKHPFSDLGGVLQPSSSGCGWGQAGACSDCDRVRPRSPGSPPPPSSHHTVFHGAGGPPSSGMPSPGDDETAWLVSGAKVPRSAGGVAARYPEISGARQRHSVPCDPVGSRPQLFETPHSLSATRCCLFETRTGALAALARITTSALG